MSLRTLLGLSALCVAPDGIRVEPWGTYIQLMEGLTPPPEQPATR